MPIEQRKKARFKHYCEFIGFSVIAHIVRCFPLRTLQTLGNILGALGYYVLTSRRRVALRNLQNAYPTANRKVLEHIAQRSFQSVATTFMEILYYPMLTREKILERVTIENPELLIAAKNRGKGCLFVTAHYGSWELSIHSVALWYNGISLAIAKSLSNPLLDTVIYNYRSAYGSKVVPMQGSVRESLKILKQGGLVCMVADQAAAKESISVEFFGRAVPTFAGPAAFCLKTGATMLLGLAVRQKNGHYHIKLHEVRYDDLQGDTEDNIVTLTQRHVQLTEQLIREAPEQWMWMHKRWKHVPDRVNISAR
ncbi:MAG: lysophospholipid acyltransferase family protein [Bacteroidetes bacterium]|nr:lysophospholipid acyltransferase family protein [Bacteroidota bacterium]